MSNCCKNKNEPCTKVSTPYGTKRVCLALDLKDDPELIAQYKQYHGEDFWEEIGKGIWGAGICVMDIYCVDTRMFMICEVPSDVDFETAWKAMGTFPRQGEWGELMAKFQQALPGHPLEWVPMERVFTLR